MPQLGRYEQLVKDYLGIVKRVYGSRLVSLCVFGSVARGEVREGSDIDLLLVVEGLDEDLGARMKELAEVRERLRRAESYKKLKEQGLPVLTSEIALTPSEVASHPPILLDVVEEGVIVYDKEGFLRKELERVRERLHELRARRVKGKEGWYWLLKPDAKLGEGVKV
ncbi:MAG: nucleotidyltransferase domain-containing protein [Thermoprotei archaeon]|nr:MAG: nucleotidyltransferase domain-containing protein [Thermoprotei archaeon]RLF13911.1 MAG: nucleotidyltransferase domain-containing protein [Thermoprotei archaeon]